ncbi:unnamed protein product [Meganyctiphanes norvegica]|uniref:Anaphase-promoting complex subunit 5 domain-containing protein n=1 Tax=Meganyctiphanes norvegica TaxID=48144 RepID=A0AAV2RZ64_MEGNR
MYRGLVKSCQIFSGRNLTQTIFKNSLAIKYAFLPKELHNKCISSHFNGACNNFDSSFCVKRDLDNVTYSYIQREKLLHNHNGQHENHREYTKKSLATLPSHGSKKRRHGIFNVPSVLLALSFFGIKTEEETEQKESELINMMKFGILAIRKGELKKAEQLLHLALKTAQESQNTQAVTYIYDLLANVAFQRDEYAKAENLFKHVMQRLISGGMAEDDNALVEISLKLASVYASMGDYEKAVSGFHFCIGTQEDKIKKQGEKNLDEDTLLLWAMSMDWFARFLININKLSEAKKHFIRAHEICERVNGPTHEQTGVLLNDIGSVYFLEGNHDEAIKYFEKAIDVARECGSIEIGSFYVNLASVYLQNLNLTEAERCCNEALLLSKKFENTDSLQEAENCMNEILNMKKEKHK